MVDLRALKKIIINKKILPIVWLVIVLAGLSIYVFQNYNNFSQLFQISIWRLLNIVVLVLFFIVLNGIANCLLYRNLMIPISIVNSIGLAIINSMANLLPFSGGLIAKGLYLKKRYGLNYTSYLSATGALYIYFLATNGIIGFISLGALFISKHISIPGYLIGGFALMVLCPLLFWLPINIKYLPERWKDYLIKIEDGWRILIDNKGLLLWLVIVQCFSVLLMAWRFMISFGIFSQEITYIECILFAAATILTRLVSIVPGGIGIREGIVAAIGIILGFDPGVSAVAVGFDRLIATSSVLIGGLYFSYVLGLDITGDEEDNQVFPNSD